ncbi:MAG: hypothetical protein Q9226_002528 [Calogaya cf. arnoldii]
MVASIQSESKSESRMQPPPSAVLRSRPLTVTVTQQERVRPADGILCISGTGIRKGRTRGAPPRRSMQAQGPTKQHSIAHCSVRHTIGLLDHCLATRSAYWMTTPEMVTVSVAALKDKNQGTQSNVEECNGGKTTAFHSSDIDPARHPNSLATNPSTVAVIAAGPLPSTRVVRVARSACSKPRNPHFLLSNQDTSHSTFVTAALPHDDSRSPCEPSS